MPQEHSDSEPVESQLPPMSGSAFQSARERVLSSGNSVLATENGQLFEVYANGKKVFLKNVPSPIQVKKGTIRTIR